MEMGGIDVKLWSWKPEDFGAPLDPEVRAEAGRFAGQPPVWDMHLFSCFLSSHEAMHNMLTGLAEQTGTHTYHCVFERQYIEPGLAEDLRQLSGIWCQCKANQEVLAKHGVTNTTLIHHPYFDEDPHLKLKKPMGLSKFYWIGRFEPRKAPDNLIKAFMRAFRPGEATLTVKLSVYNDFPYLEPEEVIEDQIEVEQVGNGWTPENWHQGVRILRGRLTKAEMLQLHAQNDVYVSASRGEGLELSAFSAKVGGRQLLLTDSGGVRDFMTEGDILVPATRTIPASSQYPWGPGATYSDYYLDDLVTGFQRMRAQTPSGARPEAKFKAENVGQAFRQWIQSFQ